MIRAPARPQGNKTEATRLLGLHRQHFYAKFWDRAITMGKWVQPYRSKSEA
ncbi:MAG: hypothetical protein KGO52_16455 [Nitrospirota bacterium]|nr:hypothetical protein [Nitrospirota bacterium]